MSSQSLETILKGPSTVNAAHLFKVPFAKVHLYLAYPIARYGQGEHAAPGWSRNENIQLGTKT